MTISNDYNVLIKVTNIHSLRSVTKIYSPLSLSFTNESFDMLVSKLAISGAMYCVAASHECTYSPVYKNPPVATVTLRTGCP